MSSQARINASRANGAKSRGPKTPEGKAISSRNAVTHGLASEKALEIPPGDYKTSYNQLLAALKTQFNPRTPEETEAVNNIALARTRQLLSMKLSTDAITRELRNQEVNDPEYAARSEGERAWIAANAGAGASNILDLSHRYEIRYQRAWKRAANELAGKKRKNSEQKGSFYRTNLNFPMK